MGQPARVRLPIAPAHVCAADIFARVSALRLRPNMGFRLPARCALGCPWPRSARRRPEVGAWARWRAISGPSEERHPLPPVLDPAHDRIVLRKAGIDQVDVRRDGDTWTWTAPAYLSGILHKGNPAPSEPSPRIGGAGIAGARTAVTLS